MNTTPRTRPYPGGPIGWTRSAESKAALARWHQQYAASAIETTSTFYALQRQRVHGFIDGLWAMGYDISTISIEEAEHQCLDIADLLSKQSV